jgi:hypothetical protein
MFTKKELKLINEALMAYGVESEETKIYNKIDKLINKPVETTNEQPKKKKKNLCHCGSAIPKNGCGSMWCPNDLSN